MVLFGPESMHGHPTGDNENSDRILRRDGGDCSTVFFSSGESAFQECDRVICPPWSEDYASYLPVTCQSPCFNASCDWSSSMCSLERASLASCPLFDAAVLQSTTLASANRTLRFVMGGTARFEGSLPYLLAPGVGIVANRNAVDSGATEGAMTRLDAYRLLPMQFLS